MNAATKRRWRRDAHAGRLSRSALRGAGTLKAVGSAIKRSESTVGHYVTDRAHPELERAFALLLDLTACPDVTARAFAEAVAEAVELREIVDADTDVLTRRGLYLMTRENEDGCVEDLCSITGVGHADALRRVASDSFELAAIIDELAERGISLHDLYRRTGGAVVERVG